MWLFVLLLVLPGVAPALSPDDLLSPEQAFPMEATVEDEGTLAIRYEIADGYYLYKDKLAFSSETAGVELGPPKLPEGKTKTDEFFGTSEIYRGTLNIEVPIERNGDTARTLEIKTVSRGCADVGICYPPFTQRTSLQLATADASPGDGLERLTGNKQAPFLPPDEAFRFSAEAADTNTLIARWAIVDGYYLYRDKFEFSLQDARGVTIGAVELPEGQINEDEFFGRTQVYRRDREITIPLTIETDANRELTLVTQYQGCAEAGLCYPPITKKVNLTLPKSGDAAASSASKSDPGGGGSGSGTTALAQGGVGTVLSAPLDSGGFQSEQDRFAEGLASGSLWLNVLLFFGAGLLLTFTPCVFPMIPILSGVIAGQGESIDTRKAFALSLIFVLAMAATYTVAGVIVGLSGENVQAVFQNPWVLSIFAGVFVLLALSMFGFYDLQMPAGIQTRLSQFSNRQEGGTFIGAGIMGLLSALIVGPCVTAPLIGALLYIAQTGDALLGGVALFALSMGMGAPLLVIGTSAGRLLPKAGPWMDAVKAVFGVLLLAVAIWLLERILPIALIMVLWALLLIISGIYLGAFDSLKPDTSGWSRLWKGVGFAMSIYGALLLVGAAGGGHDILQPLKGVAVVDNGEQRHETLDFRRVKGVDGLQQALAQAAAAGKPAMLDFYADWCISCKEMEKYTFTDPTVQATLADAVLLQTDVTANDAKDRTLLKRLGLFGPPAILFYAPDGQEQPDWRVVGYVPPEEFSRHVEKALQAGRQAARTRNTTADYAAP